jgi:hypothetical protein
MISASNNSFFAYLFFFSGEFSRFDICFFFYTRFKTGLLAMIKFCGMSFIICVIVVNIIFKRNAVQISSNGSVIAWAGPLSLDRVRYRKAGPLSLSGSVIAKRVRYR